MSINCKSLSTAVAGSIASSRRPLRPRRSERIPARLALRPPPWMLARAALRVTEWVSLAAGRGSHALQAHQVWARAMWSSRSRRWQSEVHSWGSKATNACQAWLTSRSEPHSAADGARNDRLSRNSSTGKGGSGLDSADGGGVTVLGGDSGGVSPAVLNAGLDWLLPERPWLSGGDGGRPAPRIRGRVSCDSGPRATVRSGRT